MYSQDVRLSGSRWPCGGDAATFRGSCSLLVLGLLLTSSQLVRAQSASPISLAVETPSAPTKTSAVETKEIAPPGPSDSLVPGKPTTNPAQAPAYLQHDYRSKGSTLRIFASPAADAPELGSFQFAKPIQAQQSYQGVIVAALLPSNLVLLDARSPESPRVLRELPLLAIASLSISGPLLRYQTIDGESGEYYLPKLLADLGLSTYAAPGNKSQYIEARCPNDDLVAEGTAATAVATRTISARAVSRFLVLVERQAEGYCWHGVLQLPHEITSYVLVKSQVFLSTIRAQLVLVDIQRPAAPKLLRTVGLPYRLITLAWDAQRELLVATTEYRERIRFRPLGASMDTTRPVDFATALIRPSAATGGAPSTSSRFGGDLPPTQPVRPSSQSGRGLGLAMIGIGGVATMAGLLVLFGAGFSALEVAAHNGADRAFGQGKNQRDNSQAEVMAASAGVLGGIGLPVLFIGVGSLTLASSSN